MRASLGWLLLNHGGSHPTGGDLLPCTGPGQCGEHLVHPAITPVSLSWALRRGGGGGGGMIFVCTRLWHTVFLQPGRPFLSLLYLAICLCPEGLRSTLTSNSSTFLSLLPARQVFLLWLPQALAPHCWC